MKINKDKKRVITLSIFLASLVMIVGFIFLIHNNNDKDTKEDNKCEVVCNEISLKYYPIDMDNIGIDISLTKSEIEEMSSIIKDLEYSSEIEGVTKRIFEITHCKDTIIVGENDKISINGKNVRVLSGYDKLREVLDNKKKDNNIFLYQIQGDKSLKRADLTLESIESINSGWNTITKEVKYYDLALNDKYIIMIDEDIIYTDYEHYYGKYNDNIIYLGEEINAVINQYFGEPIVENVAAVLDVSIDYFGEVYKQRGVYREILNEPYDPPIYYIASGERNTGGYSIYVDEIENDGKGNFIIRVVEKSPKPWTSVTQALTYPVCAIKFDRVPKSIKFITLDNEEFQMFNMN